MNFRRGFFRLGIVLTVPTVLGGLGIGLFQRELFGVVVGFYVLPILICVWGIYWAGVYIANGFKRIG